MVDWVLAVVRDGDESGALAMARDLALGRAARAGGAPAFVLRQHGWAHPTLTTGRTQATPDALRDAAVAAGVEIACRPTGGGWLLHLPGDIALTFCVAGPLGAGAFRLTARHIAHAIAAGCSTNDRDAVVFTGLSIPASREEVCFERADRDEVVLGDVKVAGVALARLGRSALVQTAIPLMSPGDASIRSFARRFDARREAASGALAGRDSESIVAATIDALSRRLNVPLVEWSWQPVSDERSSGQP